MGGAVQYDGSVLAAYENIVVVVIQYRLGILGYFRYDLWKTASPVLITVEGTFVTLFFFFSSSLLGLNIYKLNP